MAKISIKKVTLNIPIIESSSLKHTFEKLFKKSANQILDKLNDSDAGGNIFKKQEKKIVTALNEVSIELVNGDYVAIVGHNGSGKSTLLKLIAGMYEPTFGSLNVSGQIHTLFSATAGMDYELSGVENIRLRCAMWGKNSLETDLIVKDVKAFCQLGEFINVPIRTYSAGMLIRLSFALITSVKSEILLVDENLGAGDRDFQEKSYKRAHQFSKQAKIMVLASHNFENLKRFCNKCIIMNKGKLVEFGEFRDILKIYENKYI